MDLISRDSQVLSSDSFLEQFLLFSYETWTLYIVIVIKSVMDLVSAWVGGKGEGEREREYQCRKFSIYYTIDRLQIINYGFVQFKDLFSLLSYFESTGIHYILLTKVFFSYYINNDCRSQCQLQYTSILLLRCILI